MSDTVQIPPCGEPKRSLRLSIQEGACYAMMASVSAGAIITAFASALGATDFQFAVLSGVGTVAALGAVGGAQIVGRLGSRRRTVMMLIWNRALWFIPAIVALLPVPRGFALAALIVVILLHSVLENALGNAWMSWMTDLVPAERRSRYFSRRNAIIGAVSLAATWLVGRSFDDLRARFAFQGHSDMFAFAPFFFFAVIGGLGSIYYMGRKWEPPLHGEQPLPLFDMLRRPLLHPQFRRLLGFYVLWTLVTAVSTPFWRPHMIKNLHMNMETIAFYGIFSGLLSLVAQPLWGRVIDRVGSRPVIAVNLIGVSFLPLFWLFARPDFLWMIWVDALLTGVFWSGFNLATFNLNLQAAPRENRTAYLASISIIGGLVGFVANLLGGQIAVWCQGFHRELLGFTLLNYHVIFTLSAAGRLILLPLALRLHDEKGGSVGLLLTLVGDKVNAAITGSLQQGVELVRKVRRP